MRFSMALAFVVLLLAAVIPVAQEQTPVRRKLVSRAAPTYPELARKMQLAGTVKIKVVIATNGRLKAAEVMGGNPLFARAATDALDKWRWIPDPHETTELIELDFHP
jgi:protein TonB